VLVDVPFLASQKNLLQDVLVPPVTHGAETARAVWARFCLAPKTTLQRERVGKFPAFGVSLEPLNTDRLAA